MRLHRLEQGFGQQVAHLVVLIDHEAEHHQVLLVGLLPHLKDLRPLHVAGVVAHHFFRQVQGLHHGMHLGKQELQHRVVLHVGADGRRPHQLQAALEGGEPVGPMGVCGLVGLGGEQGIELLAHGGGQQRGQLRRQLLLDSAEGFRDDAGQGRVGRQFPAAGPEGIDRRAKHGHGIHLLAGKMRHLLAHGGFDLLEGGHAELLQNQPAVVEAGGLIVARPLDLAQAVALLHVGTVGGPKPVGGEEAPRRLEVAHLQHEAAPAVGRHQAAEHLSGPVGQVAVELTLGRGPLGRVVERPLLGRVE